jgi:hypothetical protein
VAVAAVRGKLDYFGIDGAYRDLSLAYEYFLPGDRVYNIALNNNPPFLAKQLREMAEALEPGEPAPDVVVEN